MAKKAKQAESTQSAAERSGRDAAGRHKRHTGAKKLAGATSRPRRRRGRRTLSQRLAKRLDDLAKDVPYAAQLAEKLREGCDETTLGDVIIDVMCMFAIKGNPTILRSLWERSEGKPPGSQTAEEREPRRIRTPLKAPEP